MKGFLKFKAGGETNVIPVDNIARIIELDENDSKIILKNEIKNLAGGFTIAIYADETVDELYKLLDLADYL